MNEGDTLQPPPEAIRVGVSACLAGEPVRHDGRDKDHSFVAALSRFVTLVPVCPEVEIGLGVPREPIELVLVGGRIRLRGVESAADHSEAMLALGRRRGADLAALELAGYIFKSRSPSCGLEGIPIRGAAGLGHGRGLFAAAVTEAMPGLAVEDEQGLENPERRERLLERTFAAARLQRAFAPGWRRRDLIDFHAREKLLLLPHGRERYRELGRLVAGVSELAPAALAARYRAGFLAALAEPTTVGRHVDALQHLAGHLRDQLQPGERRAIAEGIEAYRDGRCSRLAVLVRLRELAERHGADSAAATSYLHPAPDALLFSP
jgi:uncharacterized protein YbgA (DUF1722 family)/uncharacterized protein YbbK (DUF523 family)